MDPTGQFNNTHNKVLVNKKKLEQVRKKSKC